MSYPHQFGYSYSNTASSLGSPQLLVSGSPTQTSISTSCCENGRPIMTDPHTCQTVCSCQYNSPLLSGYTRMTGLPDYSSAAYVAQGYVPFGADPTAFTSVNYSSLNASYDLKDTTDSAWRSLTSQTACYPYDPTMVYPYGPGGYNMEINGGIRRKNATRETTSTLKAWLYEHRKNPYPTKGEKIMLAIITKMTLTQVSTWFANARRRLKKENKMTWSPRNRCGEDGEKGDSDIEVDEKDDDDDRPDDKSHSGDDKKDDDDLDDLVKAVSAAESNSGEDGPSRLEAKLDNGIGSLTHSRSPTSCASPPPSTSPISEPPTLAPHAGSPTPEPPVLRTPHTPSPKLLLPTATVTSSVTSHTASTPHNNGTSTYSSRPNHTAPSEGHVTPQKPRIWSLADTATSSSPPSVRRSPPQSLQSGPSVGQSIGPPPPTAPQNSFSSPLNSIRQWMEGSYPVSVSHGVGLSHAYAMAARSMSAAAGVTSTMTTPNTHVADRGALVGSRFTGSALSSHPLIFPHPDLSRLTNGLVDRLGQKGEGVSLASSLGGADGDDLTKTAFKPVLKSMH